MPKQLNVNLAFTADTSQAKKQIQDLFDSLNRIQTKPTQLFDDVQLKKASQAANELQMHLQRAVDVDTGRLDLSKFSTSLNASNKSLKDYQKDLSAIGPEGQAAFLKLSKSIAMADAPLLQANKRLNDFMTTLRNTARWQISSSVLHGLQRAIQTAFYYAQDLDKSLNNIQIVTGQNADQMARFAEEANAAAKALSTTTTTYTDAALIYYQQGLNDEEVKARTDVTVKLANVTGDSASKVSEQMTAIWNNFDDGTKSLEHYADVLTALGAATASSSDEIAGGMQQFAASASTVGLSYEYAASALATVVATTRQSENVVGNAFKTLFARLEGLNLGETLDDGTTLNKYSAALDKVGISIKDQQGNMKAMDDILDELGAKWGTLAKDQQVALAQTVGGVRQYTQLIALMDNWGEFQKNLSIANKSDGSLQEQADIYAKSWDAAKQHVQASLEDLYSTLIDRKVFTDLFNGFAKITEGVNGFIKGLGGVPGILTMISGIFMRHFAKEIPATLSNISQYFTVLTGKGRTLATQMQQDNLNILKDMEPNVSVQDDPVLAVQVASVTKLAEMKQRLVSIEGTLSQAEKDHYQQMVLNTEEQFKLLELKAKTVKTEQQSIEENKKKAIEGSTRKVNQEELKKGNKAYDVTPWADMIDSTINEYVELEKEINAIENAQQRATEQVKAWGDISDVNIDEAKLSIQEYIDEWEGLGIVGQSEDVQNMLNSLKDGLKDSTISMADLKARFQEFISMPGAFEDSQKSLDGLKAEAEQLLTDLRNMDVPESVIINLKESIKDSGEHGEKLAAALERAKQAAAGIKDHQVKFSEGIGLAASGIMQIGSMMTSISGTLDTLNSKSTSGLQKVTSLMGGLGSMATQTLGIMKTISQFGAPSWIGLIITGLTLVGTLIFKAFEHQKQLREEAMKTAHAEVEAVNEEINASESLRESFYKLNSEYQKSGNVSNEYIGQLEQLIDVYDIQDGRLLLLQHDYETLTKEIYAKIKAQKEEQAQKAQESINTYEENIRKDSVMQRYQVAGEQSKEATKTTAMIQKGEDFNAEKYDEYYNKLKEIGFLKEEISDDGTTWLTFDMNNVDIANMQELYDILQKFENEGGNLGISAGSIKDIVESEEYSNYLSDRQAKAEGTIGARFADPTDIKTLSDVKTIIDDLKNDFSESEIFATALKSSVGDLAGEYQAFAQKMQKENITDENIINQALEYYEKLSPEDRTIYLNVDLDENSVINANNQLAQWRREHQSDALKIKLQLITEASDNWQENMSADEINAWYEQYKDLFASEAEWREFLFKDFGDQQDWLGERITETKPEVIKALNEETAAMRERAAAGDLSDLYSGIPEDVQNQVKSLQARAAELQPEIDAGNYAHMQEYAQIQEEINRLTAEYPELLYTEDEALDALNQKIAEHEALTRTEMDLLAASAESFEQLEEWLQNGTIDAKAFNSGLEKLYNQLDEDVDKEEWEDLSKFLQKNAKELKGVSAELTTNERAAKKVASAILRFDDAIQDVSEHYDDWMHALKKGTAQDQAKAASEMADAYADLLDLPFDTLSGQFLQNADNLELMKAAAEGNEDAYKQLQAAVQEDIAVQAHFDTTEFNNGFNDLMNQYYQGKSLDDIQVGASLDNAGFLAGLTQMINAAGMTAEQATNYLASMGVDAIVRQKEPEMVSVTSTASVWHPPTYHAESVPFGDREFQYPAYDAGSGTWQQVTTTHMEEASPAATSLEVVSANKSSGGGFKFENASHGGGSGGSKGGGGGGGSTPKHTTQQAAAKKPTQQTEDRYHVINNQIEDLAKQYDRLSEAEERAYGKSKLALMDQQKKKLEEQYQAQRKLREEAEDYWAKDLANLKSGAFDSDGDDIADTFGIDKYLNDWRKENDKNPIELELDVNGTILNYDELVAAANERYNSEVELYNKFIEERWNSLSAEEQADEATKEAFEKDKETWDERLKNEGQYYDNFLGLIKQYEDTQDKVQEELNKEIAAYHAELDKMLEETQYEVQIRVDLDDYRLETLDFLLKNVADDAFAAAQKIALIGQQTALTADKIDAASDGIASMFDNHYDKDHVFDNKNADYVTNQFSELMKANGYKSGQDLVDALKSGTANLPELFASLNNEFSEKEVEQFKGYVKDILDGTGELWQQRKDIFDAASEQIEASNDQLDRMADQIDHLNEITGKYKDIMNVLGHNGYYEITTDQILEQSKAQQQMYRDSVAAAKERNDFAKKTLEDAEAQRALAKKNYGEDSEDYRLWDEMVKKAEDRFHETESELMSDLEEALQHARDLFDETMQLMAEDASKIMGGAMGSLEGLSNMMDQYEKTHDTFVDGYEQVYRLNKLNAEAAKAIDETNNPKAKKELMKYQQEVLDQMRAYQENGAQMSEWELQNLEKKLALRQAELALEEARNVKSQVRMQRDNEGNYSYVYTADEDSVADAEANYRDKLYEMQKANAEYIQQLQNDIVSLQQDALQQAQEAAQTYGYGTEAYFKALDNINQWYNEAVQDKYNQLEMVMGANQELQQFDVEFHARMTGDMMVADNDYITNFNDTIYSQLTGFTSSEQAANQWKETLGGYIGEAKTAINEYQENNEKTMNAAGLTLGESTKDWENWGKAASGAAKSATEESGKLATQITNLADAYNKAVNGDGEKPGILKDITSWQDTWSKFITDVTGKNTNLATSLGNIIEKLNGVGNAGLEAGKKVKEGMEQANEGGPATSTAVNTPKDTSSGSSGSGGGGGNEDNGPGGGGGDPVGTGYYEYTSNKDGKTHTTSEKMSDDTWKVINSKASCEWTMTGPTSGYCVKCGQEYQDLTTKDTRSKGTKALDLLKTKQITFASGGYTGDWGSTDGKLAVLHEKELVLNREDTANMLSAINMIRQISSVIDLNAKSASGAFSSLIAAGVNAGAQELQQEVHITAEFPNATDHNEILEAFDNVINLASMYANRKL